MTQHSPPLSPATQAPAPRPRPAPNPGSVRAPGPLRPHVDLAGGVRGCGAHRPHRGPLRHRSSVTPMGASPLLVDVRRGRPA